MQTVDLGEEQGIVLFRFEQHEQEVDVLLARSKITEFYKANKDKPDDEYGLLLLEMVQGLGIPIRSVYLATRFAAAIEELYGQLKKNGSASPASAGSTASMPAA
jgi:hypothetical protein